MLTMMRPKRGGQRQDGETLPWGRQVFGNARSYLDMLFVDHGIFRVAYLNRYRLGERAWRSAQPSPHQIRAMAREGIRTIVNLRGERRCGSYRLEKSACERYGITLVNFHIRGRRAPSRFTPDHREKCRCPSESNHSRRSSAWAAVIRTSA